MTIKEIKADYKVSTFDRGKTLLLSHKTKLGRYNVNKFIVALEKIKAGCYRIKASKCPNSHSLGSSMETYKWTLLKEIIGNHIDRYDFDSEFYNPEFREGYMEEIAVHDHLRDFLEFKHDDTQWGIQQYSKELAKGQFEIILTISGLERMTLTSADKNEVKIAYHGKNSFLEIAVDRDPSKICDAIDSLIKPEILMCASEMIQYNHRLKFEAFEVQKKEVKGLDVIAKDYKKDLILNLEEILKTLKGS